MDFCEISAHSGSERCTNVKGGFIGLPSSVSRRGGLAVWRWIDPQASEKGLDFPVARRDVRLIGVIQRDDLPQREQMLGLIVPLCKARSMVSTEALQRTSR